MKTILGLIVLGLLLTGCYSSSLTVVGPATGMAHGKVSESAISSSISYAVKKETGKSPIEHVLSENQIKSLETKKSKLSPCKQNPGLCLIVNKRLEKTRKQLLGTKLQSRIEKKNNKLFSQFQKN